jgi:hypothetical protein
VGWLIVLLLVLLAVSAVLSDLMVHDTAATSVRVQAILRRSEEDAPP